MFTSVAEGLSGRLTERATLALVVPAAVFWAGGVLALYLHGNVGIWSWGLANLVSADSPALQAEIPKLLKLSGFEQFVLLTGVVVTSALAVDRLVLPTIRLAEGYLPSWLEDSRLDDVRHALVKRQQRQLEDDRRKHDCLKETFDVHSHVERSKYERLDRRLEIQTPGRESDLMPTELGNILRAAETRPKEKYGLDVIACWPRLWLVLPESATRDLIAARAELDAAVRMSIWGGLFLIWSIWAWWAVPIGACVILIGYRIALESATFYGTLIESAFDMYRLELFNKAGWSPPGKDPSEELAYGEALSLYFWRRPDSPPPESKYAPDSGPPLESPMNEEKTRTTLPGP